MKKNGIEFSLEPLKINVEEDGSIKIEQDYHTGEPADTIYLKPEQIDIVIEWLKKAKDESLKRKV